MVGAGYTVLIKFGQTDFGRVRLDVRENCVGFISNQKNLLN